jgi:peptidoglycan/xylan/chitin deacetylase (PgdA/CDA1 family)
MNRHLSSAIKTAVFRSGFYRWQFGKARFPGLAVLCYHGLLAERRGLPFEPLHLSPSRFESHCRLIRSSFHPVSLDEVCDAWRGGRPLPARPVLVTFDDGYRSVLRLAAPILRRYKIPAAVFVCSDPIEHRTLLWYDAVARVLGECVVEQLKDVSYVEWLDMVRRFRVHATDNDPYAPLSIDELRELAATPGIEVGGHTERHAILGKASPDQQRAEIVNNVDAIQRWTQKAVRAFSYPNGRPGIDYTDMSAEIVSEAGCHVAFSTETGFATAASRVLELPRYLLLESTTGPMLAHRFAWLPAKSA